MKTFERGSTQAHQDLAKAFDKAVAKEFPKLVIIPYTVGMFRDFDTADRIIRAGYPGIPDRIVFGKGWYLFFDAKTGKAKFSPEQKAFKNRIDELNEGTEHVYKLISVEQGLNVIKVAKGFYETGK